MSTPPDPLSVVREHLAANQYFPAIRASEELLAIEPAHPEALYLRAVAMTRLGHARAWSAARDAVAAAPGDWRVHLVLSQALLKADRPAECLAAARQAVALAPASPETLTAVGEVAQQAGDPALARWAYQEALRLSPEHAPARHGLGELDLAEGRLGRAAGNFARAAAGHSPDSLASLREIARRLVTFGAGVAVAVLVGAFVIGRARRVSALFDADGTPGVAVRAAAGLIAAGLLVAALVATLRVLPVLRVAGPIVRQEPLILAGVGSFAGTLGALTWFAATGTALALAMLVVTGGVGWISRSLLNPSP